MTKSTIFDDDGFRIVSKHACRELDAMSVMTFAEWNVLISTSDTWAKWFAFRIDDLKSKL